MHKVYYLLLFSFLCTGARAQDAYHAELVNYLNTAFTLPNPTYPIGNTEAGINQRSYVYGASRSIVAAEGQDFSTTMRITTNPGLANPWDAAVGIQNQQVVAEGDVLLFVITARAAGDSETATMAAFVEDASTFDKDIYLQVEFGREWKRYLMPVRASKNYGPRGMTVGAHLNFGPQTAEIGGMTLLNFGTQVPLGQLPLELNNEDYGGFEADADWRAPAAQRIEELRKGDYTVTVLDSDGNPVGAGVRVQANMFRHDFGFGSATKARRYPGGSGYTETYVNTIENLDGRGHGFSEMTFENDLKWPGWEQTWEAPNAQTLRAIDYLHERGIDIRGHALVWPGWQNLPNDLRANAGDLDYLQRRVDNHLVDFLQTMNLDEKVTEWDVLNEVTTNTDLAATLAGTEGYTTGREVYAEIFERARELAPDASLYLNDYVTLTLKGSPGAGQYAELKSYVDELLAADAPVDGIGFQAHIGASPNSIYDVLSTIDDFTEGTDLRAKITEFDLPPSVSEELAAAYLRDFFTATFSHPRIDGIIMWNFWDVDTWANPAANLFDEDWNRTPAGDAYVDLIFGDWWTDEDLVTDANGQVTFRGFKGEYDLTIGEGAGAQVQRVKLLENTELTVSADGTVSNRPALLPADAVRLYPNPVSVGGRIQVDNQSGGLLDLKVFTLEGRTVRSLRLATGLRDLDLRLRAGAYVLRLSDGRRVRSERLLVQGE